MKQHERRFLKEIFRREIVSERTEKEKEKRKSKCLNCLCNERTKNSGSEE